MQVRFNDVVMQIVIIYQNQVNIDHRLSCVHFGNDLSEDDWTEGLYNRPCLVNR